MPSNLTVRYRLEASSEDPNNVYSVSVLTIEQTNNKMVRLTIQGDSRAYNWTVADAKGVPPHSLFLSGDCVDIAGKFDPLAVVANTIDGTKLVELLMHKAGKDHPREAEIQRLVAVNSLQVLYAIGNDVMSELYGPNWLVDEAVNLVRKSNAWVGLVELVEFLQEELQKALPT